MAEDRGFGGVSPSCHASDRLLSSESLELLPLVHNESAPPGSQPLLPRARGGLAGIAAVALGTAAVGAVASTGLRGRGAEARTQSSSLRAVQAKDATSYAIGSAQASSCFEIDINYGGSDIEGMPLWDLVDAGECQGACQLNQECLYWSYLPPDTCWLKTSKQGATPRSNTVSGPRVCPAASPSSSSSLSSAAASYPTPYYGKATLQATGRGVEEQAAAAASAAFQNVGSSDFGGAGSWQDVEDASADTAYQGGYTDQASVAAASYSGGGEGYNTYHWEPSSAGSYPASDPNSLSKGYAFSYPPQGGSDSQYGYLDLDETVTTTTTVAPNSLFCFALMMANGYEHGLITMFLKKGLSLFACDGYSVFSDEKVELSPGPPVQIYSTAIGSMKCDYGGEFNLALNTDVFVKAWKKVFTERKYMSYSWTVKIDPDCVFLPDRLRSQIQHSDGMSNVYLNDCDQGLHGPIEVIALGGMETFRNGLNMCLADKRISEEKTRWGEDVFLRHCLGMLEVNRVDDFQLLSEQACFWENPVQNGCTSGKASFHPFKDEQAYTKCLKEAEDNPPKDDDKEEES